MTPETNRYGDTLCDWSDLPTTMCAHCQHPKKPGHKTTTTFPAVTTTHTLEQTAGHPIPQYRATIKPAPLTCPHPHPNTQPLCDACTTQKSSIYTGTHEHPLQQLTEIPDLATDVEATKNHKNPAGETLTRHTTPTPATPADLETLDCLRTDTKGLLHQLQTALTEINEEANPEDTWTGICDQLKRCHRQWDQNPTTRHTINHVHTRLRTAARIPAPLKLACPRCTAPIRLQPGSQYYLCDNGHEINHWAEIDRMGRLALYQTPITLTQAATEYGIPLRQLQRLMKRIPADGKIGNAKTWGREKIETTLHKKRVNEHTKAA